jgi:hypothetical protein
MSEKYYISLMRKARKDALICLHTFEISYKTARKPHRPTRELPFGEDHCARLADLQRSLCGTEVLTKKGLNERG